MRTRFILMGAILFALPALTFADACAAGTVASVVGQTCTIGDLTFDFTSYLPYSNDADATGFGATQVTFTPIAGGFELSGDFSAVYNAGQSYEVYGQGALYYSVLSGAGGLNAAGDSLSGASLTTNPSSCCLSDYTYAFALVENSVYSEGVFTSSKPNQYQYYGQSANYNDAGSSSEAFAATPTVSGTAVVEASAVSEYATSAGYYVDGGSGTASGSFTSADFTFSEAPAAVPEPTSILLLASAALALMGTLRRWTVVERKR